MLLLLQQPWASSGKHAELVSPTACKVATGVTYHSLVIARFVVEASITAIIMTEKGKTNKHIMHSRHVGYVVCL